PTGTLLNIDPGKSSKGGLGWSVFSGMDFVEAGLARVKGRPGLGARALLLVDQVPHGADTVVVEEMVHYPGQSGPRRESVAKALLDLQAIGGIGAGHCVAENGRILYVTAHGWKGEIPKD